MAKAFAAALIAFPTMLLINLAWGRSFEMALYGALFGASGIATGYLLCWKEAPRAS